MDDNFDDVFDDKSNEISETATENTAPVEEPAVIEAETTSEPVTETEQTTEDQPRDDKGQFQSKKNWVPVEALIAERQRAQAEAAQRAEYEAKLRTYEEAQRQTDRPDPFENPDDYDQHVQNLVEQRLQAYEQNRQQQEMARQTEALFKPFAEAAVNYSQEQIAEALSYAASYAESDEAWGQEMLKSTDPVARILEEKNRHAQQRAEWDEYSRDPAAFVARKASELGTVGQTQSVFPTTANPMAATAKAPRSLASSGGGSPAAPIAGTSSEAFDAIFDSKR